MTQNVAYLRVSSLDQELDKNKAEMLHLANDRNLGQVRFVEEKGSGWVSGRQRKIAGVLDELRAGDTLLLNEFSRPGRSMLECMEITALAVQKGIRIYTVKGAWLLDDTLQSKVVAMVCAMAAEIERDLIARRTRQALAGKKAAGVRLERPKGTGKSKLDAYRPEIEALLANGSTQQFIAHR